MMMNLLKFIQINFICMNVHHRFFMDLLTSPEKKIGLLPYEEEEQETVAEISD